MIRWLLVCILNRLLAFFLFGGLVVVIGVVVRFVFPFLPFNVALVITAGATLALIHRLGKWRRFDALLGWFADWERRLDPRPRF